jgi:hypothetical protein
LRTLGLASGASRSAVGTEQPSATPPGLHHHHKNLPSPSAPPMSVRDELSRCSTATGAYRDDDLALCESQYGGEDRYSHLVELQRTYTRPTSGLPKPSPQALYYHLSSLKHPICCRRAKSFGGVHTWGTVKSGAQPQPSTAVLTRLWCRNRCWRGSPSATPCATSIEPTRKARAGTESCKRAHRDSFVLTLQ